MKLGLVIYSNEPETVWNAFRLGVYALDNKDDVKAFLLGKGVEVEGMNADPFNVTEQMNRFADKGGEILACGTCLEVRHSKESDLCPVSTMKGLYEIIKVSDRVLTF